jgi:DNA replication protein DnaC
MTRTRRGQMTEKAADASIEQACRILRLPTIRDRFGDQVAAAARQQATYQSFLSELLFIECEDREVRRKAHLVKQAGFPRTKRIEDFDFAANPNVPPALVHTLAKGAWIRPGQPVCLIGDSGTGKSHLLIGLGTAAAEAGFRVAESAPPPWSTSSSRPPTTSTCRSIARYGRVDPLCLDELGYLELDRRGADVPGRHRAGGTLQHRDRPRILPAAHDQTPPRLPSQLKHHWAKPGV